jgi:hypothetical protein
MHEFSGFSGHVDHVKGSQKSERKTKSSPKDRPTPPRVPTHPGLFVWILFGEDHIPILEPIRRLNYRIVDKIVRDLRRIYQEKPNLFDIPAFARKIY